MIKIKRKNQKPIEIDAHFKYRCPKCGWDHWISLKESQTKNFKIVCDCDTVLKPKTIKNINIQYCSISEISKPAQTKSAEVSDVSIDPSSLKKCYKILVDYGFSYSEAKTMVMMSYEKIKTNDVTLLIKQAIKSIGEHKHD